MKIYTRISNGKMEPASVQLLVSELGRHENKDICITVERKRKKRSLSQNAYYWGIVIPACRAILEEYGNDVDDEETHSFLKEHVGKLTSSVVDGKGRKAITKSSAALSTAEFEQYILRVTVWAATEGVVIQSPNEHLTPPIEVYDGRLHG
jgi:hypothetical protein